jgi:ribosomal protein L12E/L44/L45/RPP1/RPP2
MKWVGRRQNMGDTATIKISMPRSLAKYAKEMALKSKTSESEVIVKCLEEKRLNDLLAEGYENMAGVHQECAELASEATAEVAQSCYK